MLLGYIKGFKKYLMLTLPVFIFLLIHSLISNKQERFILPVLPFFIITGVVGMNEFVFNTSFWKKHKQFIKVSWLIFWSLNIIALPFVTFQYSKRSRCEAMYYLNQYKSNISSILLNDMNYDEPQMMPMFYLGKWDVSIYMVSKGKTFSNFKSQLTSLDKKHYPQFVLFYGDDNLSARVDTVKKVMPDIVPEKIIYSSFIDRLLHRLNPNNIKNQTIYIYRNKYSFSH
jgi:hypothetical protein